MGRKFQKSSFFKWGCVIAKMQKYTTLIGSHLKVVNAKWYNIGDENNDKCIMIPIP